MLALIGGAAGGITTFLLAPAQEIEAQRAVEQDRKQQDRNLPAIRAEAMRSIGNVSYSSAETVELRNRSFNGGVREVLSANSVEVGSIADSQVIIDAKNSIDVTMQPIVKRSYLVTLVGQHYEPVQITGLKARIVRQEAPLRGTLVYIEGEGGGPSAEICFDLDAQDADAKIIMENGLPSVQDYFVENFITLARDERLQLHLQVFTAKCLCFFVFDVTLADGTVLTLDNAGQSWRISAFSEQYNRAYSIFLGSPHSDSDPHYVSCVWPTDALGTILACPDNRNSTDPARQVQ